MSVKGTCCGALGDRGARLQTAAPLALHVVACVSQKHSESMPARQLYRSDWFRKARRYVESWGLPWMILSAEHGLLHPDQVIAPYDRTLSGMSPAERSAWRCRVIEQLCELPRAERVVFLAGL